MDIKERMVQLLSFILVSLVIVTMILFLAYHFKLDSVPAEEQVWKIFQPQPETKIPGDQEREELEEEYKNILEQIDKIAMPEEVESLYNNVMSANVSSIANKNFNVIDELFKECSGKITEIESIIIQYNERYDQYVGLENKIPWYWFNAKNEYANFMASIEEIDKNLSRKVQELSELETELYNYYISAKERADALFNRDYYELTIICFYEDGSGSTLGIACVANVIENRINSSEFWYAHNAHDVIWAPLQYEPTWTTPMNKTTPRVQKIVENYLRGRIDTGMPSNVLYQASFKQKGKEIWNIIDTEYFCFG